MSNACSQSQRASLNLHHQPRLLPNTFDEMHLLFLLDVGRSAVRVHPLTLDKLCILKRDRHLPSDWLYLVMASGRLLTLNASFPSFFKRSAISSGTPSIISTSFERTGPDFGVGYLMLSTSSIGCSMIIYLLVYM